MSDQEKYLPGIKTMLRENYVKLNGNQTVLLIVHIKGRKIRFNTGIEVSEQFFDSGSERILTTHPQARDYNLIIESCKSRINKVYIKYRLQHMELTPELLKKEYRIKTLYIDFYKFAYAAIRERSGEISGSSIKQHLSSINKLKAFKKTLMFSELTEDLIKKFTRYLKVKLKNGPGTVTNTLKNIKVYINLAIRQGIIQKNPFDNVKFIRSKPDRLFLEEDELRTLIDVYKKGRLLPEKHLTLRAYLFGCFTGLRISDIKNLTPGNIIGNLIVISPQKTRSRKPESVKIPITKFTRKLIDASYPYESGRVFDLWPDHVLNLQIKEITKAAGINKKLTFHSARHTFATIFLRRTKNLAALQKLLGHSNITETMIYAHILTDDIENEMKAMNDFF